MEVVVEAVSYSLNKTLVPKIHVFFRLRRRRLVRSVADAAALNFGSFPNTLKAHFGSEYGCRVLPPLRYTLV